MRVSRRMILLASVGGNFQRAQFGGGLPVPEGQWKLAGGNPAEREPPPDTSPKGSPAPAGRWNNLRPSATASRSERVVAQASPPAGLRTVSVRRDWKCGAGGGTPPQPAGEEACAACVRTLKLARRAVFRLTHKDGGRRLQVLQGTVWLTGTPEGRDEILQAGAQFILTGKGPFVIEALSDLEILLPP